MLMVDEYDKLYSLCFKLKGSVTLLYVIYDCMSNDAFSSRDLAPAVHAAYEHLDGILEELQHLQREIKARMTP